MRESERASEREREGASSPARRPFAMPHTQWREPPPLNPDTLQRTKWFSSEGRSHWAVDRRLSSEECDPSAFSSAESIPAVVRAEPAALGEVKWSNSLHGMNDPFPLYVMKMSDFLELDLLRPHNELMEMGLLTKLEDDDRTSSVNFISHQWCGRHEADPHGAHLRTMQTVFRMVANGEDVFASECDKLSFFRGYTKMNSQFIMDLRRHGRGSHASSTESLPSSRSASPSVSPIGFIRARRPSEQSLLIGSLPPRAQDDSSPSELQPGSFSPTSERACRESSSLRPPDSGSLRRRSHASLRGPGSGVTRRRGNELQSAFAASVADGYVWMDYISIPQVISCSSKPAMDDVSKLQQHAISSIPTYVARANNFWVCAPSGVRHEDGGECDYSSWETRGWCRMEETCLALARHGDSRALMVTQPLDQPPRVQVHDSMDRFTVHSQEHSAVLTGSFTCCQRNHVVVATDGTELCIPCDKQALEPLLISMYETKLTELRTQFSTETMVEPFWDVLGPSMAKSSAFFKHMLLRMNRMHLLAKSVRRPDEEWQPTATVGMPPCYWKPLEALTVDDLEDYLYTWGTSDLEIQREELAAMAVREGHLTLLRYIVEVYGAPFPLGPNRIGLTPLQEASRSGVTQLVKYILDRFGPQAAMINHRSSSSWCGALSDAAMRGHVHVVRILLSNGADVHLPRTDGKTALHCAAEFGYHEVVQELLSFGANPLVVDGSGNRPLQLAKEWHHRARELLEAAERRWNDISPENKCSELPHTRSYLQPHRRLASSKNATASPLCPRPGTPIAASTRTLSDIVRSRHEPSRPGRSSLVKLASQNDRHSVSDSTIFFPAA